jgi:hypothetical protein
LFRVDDDVGEGARAHTNVFARGVGALFGFHCRQLSTTFIVTTSTLSLSARNAQLDLGLSRSKLFFWYRHPELSVSASRTPTRDSVDKAGRTCTLVFTHVSFILGLRRLWLHCVRSIPSRPIPFYFVPFHLPLTIGDVDSCSPNPPSQSQDFLHVCPLYASSLVHSYYNSSTSRPIGSQPDSNHRGTWNLSTCFHWYP